MSDPTTGKVISLKMLLSHTLAGSLIGRGGKAIQDLNDLTGAKVRVSGNTEYYPGTSERVVLIVGELPSVILAQNLIWEMVAIVTSAVNPKEVEWNPREVVTFLGRNEGMEVSGKITIPAAAGGLILGRGGANIQSIAEESGAHATMTSKEDAIFTQERVLTISGRVGSCVKCTTLVLHKLDEPMESTPYINRGTSYALPLNSNTAYGSAFPTAAFNGYSSVPYPGLSGGGGGGGQYRRGHAGPSAAFADTDSALTAETTMTFMVPDDLVGNIFGRQGATMREIQSISRANVSVSPRLNSVDFFAPLVLHLLNRPTPSFLLSVIIAYFVFTFFFFLFSFGTIEMSRLTEAEVKIIFAK